MKYNLKNNLMALALASSCMLSLGSTSDVLASDRLIKVQIGSDKAYTDGVESIIDAVPFQDANWNTMVPVRFISTALGIDDDDITYKWEIKEVTIVNGNETLKFKVGDDYLTKTLANGSTETYTMLNNAVAQIIDGRTFVPLRTIGEIFGVDVDWDQNTKTVTLVDKSNSNSGNSPQIITTQTTTEFTTQTTTAQITNSTSDDISQARQFEEEVVRLVNIERANEGLAPLKIFETAMDLAREKSQDMVDRNYFSHEDPVDGSYIYKDLMKYSYTAAENIASGQRTPAAVVDSWMNSTGHRANILNENFEYIGVGFVDYKWTQMFCATLNSNAQLNTPTTQNTTETTTQTTTAQINNSTSDDISQARQFEEEVVRLVNIERAKEGLYPLEIYEPAMDLARTKAEDMADRNYFSHADPNGYSLWNELSNASSENIAAGQRSPEQAVASWMSSTAGHRENILSSSHKGIGVGFGSNSNSDWGNYWAQIFVRSIPQEETTTQTTTKPSTTEPTTQTTTQSNSNSSNSTVVKDASTHEAEFIELVNNAVSSYGHKQPFKVITTMSTEARNAAKTSNNYIDVLQGLPNVNVSAYMGNVYKNKATAEDFFNSLSSGMWEYYPTTWDYILVGFDNNNWYLGFVSERNSSSQNTTQATTSRVTTEATTQATTSRVTTEATTQATTTRVTTEATTQTTTQSTTVDARAYEEEVVRLVNIERANVGLAPLEIYETAMDLARAKSQDMVNRNYFSHEDPVNGSYMYSELLKYSYTAAENIASGQRTPAAVVDSWMNSPGHKANILNSSFKNIGVGFVNYKWTQMFCADVR